MFEPDCQPLPLLELAPEVPVLVLLHGALAWLSEKKVIKGVSARGGGGAEACVPPYVP